MQTLTFVKLSNKWFVDIPYDGPVEDLQMVNGSDQFLDNLAKYNPTVRVKVTVSTEELPKYDYCFVISDIDSGGATYVEKAKKANNIWICNVTKLIFGEFPRNLYITNIYSS